MKIESGSRGLDDLKPHPRNYNRHTAHQVERMADRMRMVAYTAPVIIRPDGMILAGHLRRDALLHLRAEGYPPPPGVGPDWSVPVRVFSGTESQELAVLAGDNPDPIDLDYDPVGLAAILEELQGAGALDSSGYDAERLQGLLASIAESVAHEPEGAFPEAPVDIPVSDTRMVQLFYNGEEHRRFLAAVSACQARYETKDMSATVLQSLEHVASPS